MYKVYGTLAGIVARITTREERIKRAKDNLNCFSADSADSNTTKTFPPRKINDLENHHRRSNLDSFWYAYNWKVTDALGFQGRTLFSAT